MTSGEGVVAFCRRVGPTLQPSEVSFVNMAASTLHAEGLMRCVSILVLALALAACANKTGQEGHSAWLQPVGNLPPPLFQDCVDFVLLDDRCVRAWYGCMRGKDERGVCVDAWESCCTLPGRGNRKTMASVSVRTVDR